jgi:hypothetical protein
MWANPEALFCLCVWVGGRVPVVSVCKVYCRVCVSVCLCVCVCMLPGCVAYPWLISYSNIHSHAEVQSAPTRAWALRYPRRTTTQHTNKHVYKHAFGRRHKAKRNTAGRARSCHICLSTESAPCLSPRLHPASIPKYISSAQLSCRTLNVWIKRPAQLRHGNKALGPWATQPL